MNPTRPLDVRVRGFTLIELLTVIAIIGILAAIIIPTVGRVRDSARSAACLSNLRELGKAASMFAMENRERLPPGVSSGFDVFWPQLVEQYLSPKSEGNVWNNNGNPVLFCPVQTRASNANIIPNYGSNQNLMDWNTTGRFTRRSNGSLVNVPSNWSGVRLNAVRNPSTTLLYADKVDSGDNLFVQPGQNDPSATAVRARHGGNSVVNVVFVGGNVRGLKRTDLAVPPPTGGVNYWNP